MSQAEHGPDSQALLVTDSIPFAEKVLASVTVQQATLLRQSLVEKSLSNSVIILVDTLEEATDISNQYAPEHLSLQVESPEKWVDSIRNAGAVFVGPWTPETMGDYLNGSNHVLPTYGCADRMSGLSVGDFMKYISIQTVSSEALRKLGPVAMNLAEVEGLDAHKNAVALRLSSMEDI